MSRMLLGILLGATLLVGTRSDAQTVGRVDTSFASGGRYTSSAGWGAARVPATGTTRAQIDVVPYSASYLPAHEGPLSRSAGDCTNRSVIENGFMGGECDLFKRSVKQNACLPASQKFDKAVDEVTGDSPNFTDEYNRTGYRPDAETWEGYCHNWANAAMDPAAALISGMDRVYGNVPFGVGDLRELATFMYPNDQTMFIGVRNYGTKQSDQAFTPLDLQAIFLNHVGPGKTGIVLDVDPGTQVWNHPFYKYEMQTNQVSASGTPVSGHVPAGGKVLKVKLTGHYAIEGAYGYRGEPITNSKTWTYFLAVDREGGIAGAAWDAASEAIPDFAWLAGRGATSSNWAQLEKIARTGIPISQVEKFCERIARAAQDGQISSAERQELTNLYKQIGDAVDDELVSSYLHRRAAEHGVDYSELSAILG